MPITVAYCRNDLRKNDIYITSKSGGRLAPGCATVVTMDIDVTIYTASGYLEFSWEQLYGPPVTLTYPDPLDLTIVTFPYTADGYERKFRFWVNQGTGNVYKRHFYDILVGDNFFESSSVNINGPTHLHQTVEYKLIKNGSTYNVIATWINNGDSYSELWQGNTKVASTAVGAPIAYYGLLSKNYTIRFYSSEYLNQYEVFNLNIPDINYLGELASININGSIRSNGSISETTDFNTIKIYSLEETPIISVNGSIKVYTYATDSIELNTLINYNPIADEVTTVEINGCVVVLTAATALTEGAGVIDI